MAMCLVASNHEDKREFASVHSGLSYSEPNFILSPQIGNVEYCLQRSQDVGNSSQKPLQVLHAIRSRVIAGPGSVVDAFGGSGSITALCALLRINCIYLDQSKSQYLLAVDRVSTYLDSFKGNQRAMEDVLVGFHLQASLTHDISHEGNAPKSLARVGLFARDLPYLEMQEKVDAQKQRKQLAVSEATQTAVVTAVACAAVTDAAVEYAVVSVPETNHDMDPLVLDDATQFDDGTTHAVGEED